ncbi:MAG: hypothetical protein ACM3XM_06950 [Mycobacterium leprae]
MRKFVYGILIALLLSVGLAPSALAMEQRTGSRVAVEQSESIDDDLILSGTTVTINGAVHGDVFAFAQSVEVNGTIDGNLITAGSNIDIKGTVKGSVYGAGSDMLVRGRIDGTLVSVGDRVNINEGASVGRSWIGFGKMLSNMGDIGRGILTGSSLLNIGGHVGREVKTWGDLVIGDHAVVNGPVDYTSGAQAIIRPGAHTGPVTFHPAKSSAMRTPWSVGSELWHIVLKLCAFLLFGLALLALFPGLKSSFPQAVRSKPWEAPLAGFLALLAVPVGAIVLLITVVGIPFGITALLLFPVAIYVGQILLSWTVADLLANQIGSLRSLNWVVLFALGALLTTVLTALPVVGVALGFIAVIYGLGGLWFALPRRRKAA